MKGTSRGRKKEGATPTGRRERSRNRECGGRGITRENRPRVRDVDIQLDLIPTEEAIIAKDNNNQDIKKGAQGRWKVPEGL